MFVGLIPWPCYLRSLFLGGILKWPKMIWIQFRWNWSLTSERMSSHCEGGRKGHHHFQASLGLDDSYAIRKVMWIFQQPSNHPKNGFKLFLKDLSYFYAPAFLRDIIVMFFQIILNFRNHNKSMRFIKGNNLYSWKHVWKVEFIVFLFNYPMFSLLVNEFEFFCWPESALLKFEQENQISWLTKKST